MEPTICEVCEGVILEGEGIETEDGLVCPSCGEDYFECDHCSKMIPTDDMVSDSNTALCQDCYDGHYVTCEDCNAIVYQSDSYYVDCVGHLCYDCFGESYTWCGGCGQPVHTDDAMWSERNEEYYCESCYPVDSPAHDYGYKPKPLFIGEGTIHYGVELEVDDLDDIEATCEELMALDPEERIFYLKEDGSLNNGVEIVFHPRTPMQWVNAIPLLEKITSIVRSGGGRSFDANTCGVHVHRSRGNITDVQTAKLITAFVRLRDKIETVCQRRGNNYASYSSLESIGGENKCKIVYDAVKDGSIKNGRGILNFRNEDTIEYRGYKGTLKIDSLMGYIMFTHYFTRWTNAIKVTKVYMEDPSRLWENFVDSIRNGEQIGHGILATYLTAKGVWY